ncbi:hypothetical protein COE50_27600 [Bacillus anthracis]|nr:hypothetical protein COE50_27600 [Bacillus anthracis]
MIKKLKWLSLLFVMLSAFLVGCGDLTKLKKGETFLQEKSQYSIPEGKSTIEIISDNQWKYTDNKDGKSSVYDVRETKFKAGTFKVLTVTKSNDYSENDLWNVRTGKQYVIGLHEGGFSLVKVGLVDRHGVTDWEYGNSGYKKGRNFEEDYEEAKDKEAFLKDIADHANLKYKKINS